MVREMLCSGRCGRNDEGRGAPLRSPAPRASIPPNASRTAHELLDLRRLAAVLVLRVGMPAVDALFAEAGALPDEIVDRALELLHAILERRRRRWLHRSP